MMSMNKINYLAMSLLYFNFIISLFSLFIENQWLISNSFFLFVIQFIIYAVYILYKVKFVIFFLSPSIVMLLYLSFSFSLGSYFVPREIGFLTVDFIQSILTMKHTNLVVFYWLNVFNILFLVSFKTLEKQNEWETEEPGGSSAQSLVIGFSTVFIFVLVSLVDSFATFGFQLALVVSICIIFSNFKKSFQTPLYLFVLLIFVANNYENKREVLMALIAMVMCFSYFNRLKFTLSIKSFVLSTILISSFVTTILASSILRGYGGMPVSNLFEAVKSVPNYITSERFTDSLVDNFEISHTYPAAVLPVEYIIEGRMDILAGESLIKPFFLLIPRKVYTAKPQSVLTLFTIEQAPGVYAVGGSFPVAFPAELFVNFSFLGLLALCLFTKLFDYIFLLIFRCNRSGLQFKLTVCFTSLLFILIRGGGADLMMISLVSASIICMLTSIKGGKVIL
jgi:hypothetical protein